MNIEINESDTTYQITDENNENITVRVMTVNKFSYVHMRTHIFDSKRRFYELNIPAIPFDINNLQYHKSKKTDGTAAISYSYSRVTIATIEHNLSRLGLTEYEAILRGYFPEPPSSELFILK